MASLKQASEALKKFGQEADAAREKIDALGADAAKIKDEIDAVNRQIEQFGQHVEQATTAMIAFGNAKVVTAGNIDTLEGKFDKLVLDMAPNAFNVLKELDRRLAAGEITLQEFAAAILRLQSLNSTGFLGDLNGLLNAITAIFNAAKWGGGDTGGGAETPPGGGGSGPGGGGIEGGGGNTGGVGSTYGPGPGSYDGGVLGGGGDTGGVGTSFRAGTDARNHSAGVAAASRFTASSFDLGSGLLTGADLQRQKAKLLRELKRRTR